MHSAAQDVPQADQMVVKHYHKNQFAAPKCIFKASIKSGCFLDMLNSGYTEAALSTTPSINYNVKLIMANKKCFPGESHWQYVVSAAGHCEDVDTVPAAAEEEEQVVCAQH